MDPVALAPESPTCDRFLIEAPSKSRVGGAGSADGSRARRGRRRRPLGVRRCYLVVSQANEGCSTATGRPVGAVPGGAAWEHTALGRSSPGSFRLTTACSCSDTNPTQAYEAPQAKADGEG